MKKLLLVLGFFVDFMIVGKKVQLTDVVGCNCYKHYINYSKMKRTLLPITLVTLLSIFIYSCSSGDDDSAPPSVIQTKPEEFSHTCITLETPNEEIELVNNVLYKTQILQREYEYEDFRGKNNKRNS